jgi:hypothetical protein
VQVMQLQLVHCDPSGLRRESEPRADSFQTDGVQLIFALSSMLAYLSRTDIAIRQLEKLSWDWIKMDCSGGKCYGLLAVSGLLLRYRQVIGSLSRFTAFASLWLCSTSYFLLCWWALGRQRRSVQPSRMGKPNEFTHQEV